MNQQHEIRQAVERMLADGGGYATLVDSGFAGVGVEEQRGGSGGSLADAQVVLELAAYHEVGGPLAETTWFAAWLLAGSGLDAPTGTATVAAGPLTVVDGRVSGSFARVPYAGRVDEIVVLGDGVLARVPAAACRLDAGENLAGEDRSSVYLDEVEAECTPTTVTAEQLELRGALARAVQISGGARRALDRCVRYVTEREQFGRPISKFQAVQHLLACIASEAFVVDVSSRAAVAAVGTGAERLAIAAAKQNASVAARRIARSAHQLHGAMGATHEHDLRLTTTRLWSWAEEFGNATVWEQRLAEWSLAEPDLWAWLSSTATTQESA